jgi:hypothetical protein
MRRLMIWVVVIPNFMTKESKKDKKEQYSKKEWE